MSRIELGKGLYIESGMVKQVVTQVGEELVNTESRTLRVSISEHVSARIAPVQSDFELSQFDWIEVTLPSGLETPYVARETARLLIEVEILRARAVIARDL